jgi:hypothetical protein
VVAQLPFEQQKDERSAHRKPHEAWSSALFSWVTMVSESSSASPSGRLTGSEWAAIGSSLAFVVIWFGILFA